MADEEGSDVDVGALIARNRASACGRRPERERNPGGR